MSSTAAAPDPPGHERFTPAAAAMENTGLTVTVPIVALTTATLGIPQAAGHLTLAVVAASIGLAILFPVLPFAL